MVKELILRKIIDYLKLIKWDYKKCGKWTVMVRCPFCKGDEDKLTAQIVPNTSKIHCHTCNKYYNLIDIVKQLEPDKKDLSEEDILQYLKETLKVDVTTEKEVNDLDKLLSRYVELGFDCVPIAHHAKNPIEKEWQKNSHKNKEEWGQWLASGLNLGCKSGELSNLTIIDIDQLEIPEELKKILGDTLIQKTPHGWQYYYKYETDLPKTRINKYKLDIENVGGQCVIQPSITDNQKRYFLDLNKVPIKMPDELKKLLLSEATVPRKTQSEKIKEDIQEEKFNLSIIKEGSRSNDITRLGGVIRKILPPHQTEQMLHILNDRCCEIPLSYNEIRAMANSLEHYTQFDQQELAHEIIKYLKDVKTSTKSDLELAISGNWTKGETKKRLNKTLQYLIKEDKITQRGKKIEIVEEMDWKDTIVDVGVPVDFKVPYFHNYAHFNKGDIIILGSQNKYGKSHLAINMIKRLVDQGIKPYYIYSESGGRWAKVALHLGLKDRDFYRVPCTDPDKVKLKDNSVTVYDWVRPNKQEGFARTDILFGGLTEKAEKAHGFLICFVQLRDTDKFFAPDQIGQYPAFLVRYLYENPNDGTYTYFSADDVRDPKIRAKRFKIPSIYDWDTKQVKLVEELSEEEKAKVMKKLEKDAKEK